MVGGPAVDLSAHKEHSLVVTVCVRWSWGPPLGSFHSRLALVRRPTEAATAHSTPVSVWAGGGHGTHYAHLSLQGRKGGKGTDDCSGFEPGGQEGRAYLADPVGRGRECGSSVRTVVIIIVIITCYILQSAPIISCNTPCFEDKPAKQAQQISYPCITRIQRLSDWPTVCTASQNQSGVLSWPLP